MSLDVSLYRKRWVSYDGVTFEEPHNECVFDANITHNLGKMAEAAGIYYACWQPDKIGAAKANDILPILEKGYKDMEERPEYYRQFDAENGWGTYKDFMPWIKEYMEACRAYPDATIEVDR